MSIAFYGLLLLGLFAVAVGVFGFRRGRVVAVRPLNASRGEQPALFWFGVGFQLLLGLGLLLSALDEAVPFGFNQLLSSLGA
jgi:hypothetical protein